MEYSQYNYPALVRLYRTQTDPAEKRVIKSALEALMHRMRLSGDVKYKTVYTWLLSEAARERAEVSPMSISQAIRQKKPGG